MEGGAMCVERSGRATFTKVAGRFLSSFFGKRKRAEQEADPVPLSPEQLVVGALVGGVILVVALIVVTAIMTSVPG
jgi:hypothetical protein